MYNPSLQQEPRYEPAKVVPLSGTPSMLDWLIEQGRIIRRDSDDKESLFEAVDTDLLEIEGDYYDTDDDGDDDLEDIDDDDEP